MNINKNFEGLTKNKAVEDKFYGASFLGKEVVTGGSSLKYDGEGSKSDILFKLSEPAQKVMIRIFDQKNNMVGEMWKENIGRGNQNVTWDGMRLDGAYAGKGEFRTKVFAWDRNAEPIDVQTKTNGLVESVYFENGETVLVVSGKKVFLRDVDSFHNPGKLAQIQQAGAPKAAAPAGVVEKMAQAAKRIASNLPTATKPKNTVNLEKMNSASGIESYKKQLPTTGLTNAYEVE